MRTDPSAAFPITQVRNLRRKFTREATFPERRLPILSHEILCRIPAGFPSSQRGFLQLVWIGLVYLTLAFAVSRISIYITDLDLGLSIF
jgi:hypothetical protein